MKWYRRAAEQDHVDAQYNLGFMYANGEGVPPDYAEAAKWYRRAAEQGDGISQSTLASCMPRAMGSRRSLFGHTCG